MTPLPEMPLVTILTPSFNTGQFIDETLRSVEQQDYPRVEHIVLDSDSTDETPAILAQHPSVRLIRPAPQGLSAKINHGFSIGQGDIFGWINADDFYLPGAITKAVEALRQHPEAAVVYCNYLQVDVNSVVIDRERTKQATWREMLACNYVPLETAFVRREALERVGPVDTRYPLVQDWDLWLRISKEFPILYVDDRWACCRVREGQRMDLYKYEFWAQAREMTREHGARFWPLFLNYWGTKLGRAGNMVRRGQFEKLGVKLRKYIVSFGPHLTLRRFQHGRGDSRNDY